MLTRLLLVAALAAIPTQALATPKAADGYKFEGAEFFRTHFEVEVVVYDTAEEVVAAAKDAGAKMAASKVGTGRLVRSKAQAWSRLRDNICEIHMLKAEVKYQPELIGHEFAHCIYGRWHP